MKVLSIASRHLAVRAVTRGPNHHFFGYYDNSPWDSTGRYMLTLETTFIHHPPMPLDAATICLIDLKYCSSKRIAETRS